VRYWQICGMPAFALSASSMRVSLVVRQSSPWSVVPMNGPFAHRRTIHGRIVRVAV